MTIGKLAGSKIVSYVGVALTAAGTVCATMRSDVESWLGAGGIKGCAAVAVLGAIVAALGKGLGDRRTGKKMEAIALPDGIKANERGTDA